MGRVQTVREWGIEYLLKYVGRERNNLLYQGVGKPMFWRIGEKIIEGHDISALRNDRGIGQLSPNWGQERWGQKLTWDSWRAIHQTRLRHVKPWPRDRGKAWLSREQEEVWILLRWEKSQKSFLADTEGALFGVYLGEPITGLPSTWRIREREDQIILDSQRDSSPLPPVMSPKCFWRTFSLNVWTVFPNL